LEDVEKLPGFIGLSRSEIVHLLEKSGAFVTRVNGFNFYYLPRDHRAAAVDDFDPSAYLKMRFEQ